MIWGFFSPFSSNYSHGQQLQAPQTLTESNKARSSCQRGGVKEVLGVTYVAPKLLPECVAKLQLECLPHCATQKSLFSTENPRLASFSCRNFLMLADLQRVSGLTLHL